MPLSPAIDGVWIALQNDAQIMNFKGLTVPATAAQIATYIVETEETDGLVDATSVPMILVYTRPGRPDPGTKQLYNDKIVVDVYAATDYTTHAMADQAFAVLHNANLPSPNMTMSACRFSFGTSFKTGIVGVKAHRLYFDVSYLIG